VIVRLDVLAGELALPAVRARIQCRDSSEMLVHVGAHLPLASDSVDEIRLGRALAYVDDLVASMEELWRISKAGALVHARLPHASSTWATTRDPALRRGYTLETFDFFTPDRRNGRTAGTFELERARLRLKASPAGGGRALAAAIEGLANRDRGMQYRWERWLSPLIGGFEEFSIVLSAVKDPPIA
jgi:hypothetical protein